MQHEIAINFSSKFLLIVMICLFLLPCWLVHKASLTVINYFRNSHCFCFYIASFHLGSLMPSILFILSPYVFYCTHLAHIISSSLLQFSCHDHGTIRLHCPFQLPFVIFFDFQDYLLSLLTHSHIFTRS
jgi:hypothetical protein